MCVDSTSVRIFSGGDINSKSKAWVRYIKLQYREKLMPFVTVPTNVRVMTGIDRDGRSSDHVSFYNLGDISCRLSCANESGDGSGSNGTRSILLPMWAVQIPIMTVCWIIIL